MKLNLLIIIGIFGVILLSGCGETEPQNPNLCSNEKGYTTDYSPSGNYIVLSAESQQKLMSQLRIAPEYLNEISDLVCIEKLDLSNSKAKDLTPLLRLTKLKSLDLDDTRVSNLNPITQLPELETLSISYTQITDLSPLKNMANYGEMTVLITKDTEEECNAIFQKYAETQNILCANK